MNIDSELTAVHWDDGDTFSVKPFKKGKKIRARLKGYNTLESYGPVHRWGNWETQDLYNIAQQATLIARSSKWTCTTTGKSGGYGRITADCPELRQILLKNGLAHSFVVDGKPSTIDLKLQQEAIKKRVGMWSKGVPSHILTSLHSADERKQKGDSYNRVCSTKTAHCLKSLSRSLHYE